MTELFRVTADPRFRTGDRGRIFPSLSLHPDGLTNGEGLHGTGSHFRCHSSRRTETPDEVSGEEKAGKWHGSLGFGARPPRRAQAWGRRTGSGQSGGGSAREREARVAPSAARPGHVSTRRRRTWVTEASGRTAATSLVCAGVGVCEVEAESQRRKHSGRRGHLSHVP